MPAILFLCIGSFMGILLLQSTLSHATTPKSARLLDKPLFYIPSGILIGLTFLTFTNYFAILLIQPIIPTGLSAIIPASILSCLAACITCIILIKKRKQFLKIDFKRTPANSFIFYGICIVLFIVVSIYLFYSTFYRKDNILYSGFTTFSDFAPHTALVSAFAKGGNYPVEYPHFPGDQISYHFFFYFLCGTLHALGLPFEHAINIPSILASVSTFTMLGVFTVWLSGKTITFLIAPILLLFRQSFAFISLYEILKLDGLQFPAILRGMFTHKQWIGDAPYDNWGLWSINVYANQRHLLWGMALLLVALSFYLPYLQQALSQIRQDTPFLEKAKTMLLSRNTWLVPGYRARSHILPLLIIVTMPYFHGSALIALLLILLCLSIFSSGKLFFLITALVAVFSSLIQSRFFSGGVKNVANLQFVPGFVIPLHTGSALDYLIKCFGLVVPLALLYLFFLKEYSHKIILLACFFPFAFAFAFQMTVDITANHKFIQITLILFCLFEAIILERLFNAFSKKKKSKESFDSEKNPDRKWLSPSSRIPLTIACKVLAISLFFSSTITGIIEWSIYRNMNRQTISIRFDSQVAKWIEENTPAKSVFLTAPYHFHSFFLSGRFVYYGHPYYAWSGGHDTNQRLAIYQDLLLGCDNQKKTFLELCRQENIRYVLIDDSFRTQESPIDELFFQRELEEVANFPEENNSIIYKIPI